MFPCFRFFLLAASLLASSAYSLRPVQEYQVAIAKVMASYLSPANMEQAKAINSTLLADNVIIRVDVTENYVGREKGTEYIWGLFANTEQSAKNGTTQLLPYPVSSTLQSLVIQPPMIASSVLVNFSYPTINTFLPFQIDQFIRFNDEELTITSWDVTFRRFAEAFYVVLEKSPLLHQIAKENDIELTPQTNVTEVLAHHAIKDICTVHEDYCTGDDRQYSSYKECYRALMSKTFGQPWQAGQDTVMCRYLHKSMLPMRPTVHCPHIGLSGGGMCAQNDYSRRVLMPPFTESLIAGL